MEQIQNQLRAAQGAKNGLAMARAMEKELQRPQLLKYTPGPDASEPQPSGGEAGLARIVGKGKHTSNSPLEECLKECKAEGSITDEAYNKLMKVAKKRKIGDSTKLHGGFWGLLAGLAAPLIGKLFGQGKMEKSAHDKLMKVCGKNDMESDSEDDSPGYKHGKELGKHLRGRGSDDAFLSNMARGLMRHKMAGSGMSQIAHAPMEAARLGLAGQALGGQDVPPNGLAPVAYGNVPQAPKSWKRNAVGMGMAGAGPSGGRGPSGGGSTGAGKLTITHGAGKKRAPSQRNMMISQLMKKGMSLGEASKYLKENPQG